MMELIGTRDLPCPPVTALAEAPKVEPDEEDRCVVDGNDEEGEDDNGDEGVPFTIAKESR